jgi:hypothetical protein
MRYTEHINVTYTNYFIELGIITSLIDDVSALHGSNGLGTLERL